MMRKSEALKMTMVGVLGAALMTPLAASANLITDGSFSPTMSDPFSSHDPADDPDTWVLSPGSTAIAGWTVVGQQVAWIGPKNDFGLSAAPGNGGGYFLDLTGYKGSSPFGGVSTMVNTVVGQEYHLSFDLGSNLAFDTDKSGVIAPKVQVLNSTTGTTRTFTAGIIGQNTWEDFSLNFKATSAMITLTFSGATFKGLPVNYIGLDNVNLTKLTAVPEPTTLIAGALLLLPFGASTLRILLKNRLSQGNKA